MNTVANTLHQAGAYPVRIRVEPALDGRNRLTTAFRLVLALPHLLLVGGPVAAMLSWTWGTDGDAPWGAGTGGVLGAAAAVAALVAWFAIVFTGRHPAGLWSLGAYYLRWRVKAVAYVALLRDEHPPFGEGAYPVEVDLTPPGATRDRLTVAFRIVLALPHLLALWALGIAWGLATVVAWVAILFTGRHPGGLYDFAVGVLRWSVRVEAYLLLLCDEYPPFSLE